MECKSRPGGAESSSSSAAAAPRLYTLRTAAPRAGPDLSHDASHTWHDHMSSDRRPDGDATPRAASATRCMNYPLYIFASRLPYR